MATTDRAMTPSLRLMQRADLAAYKQLRDQMLSRHEQAFTSDAETETVRDVNSYASRLGAKQGGSASGHTLFTLTAWQGRQLVGALTCEREPRRKVQHVAHLIGMMVSDAVQGQGIGRAMLAEARQQLTSWPDLELLTLSVTRSNTPAVRLYEHTGFQPYGCLEGAVRLPDGRYVDKLLMSLRLRPPAR